MNSRNSILVGIAVSMSWIVFTVGDLCAQQNLWYEKNWEAYTNYFSTTYGISNSAPEQFIDLDQYYVIHKIRENRRVGYLQGPVFQATDKECIVMYPAIPKYVTREDMKRAKKTVLINRRLAGDTSNVEPKVATNSTAPRFQITGEAKAATGLYDNSGKPLKDTVHFDFNDYVTIISGKKARKMFNADSIYIYNLPLQKPYREKYTYRTGMVLTKKDRATLFFKWFFTTKGKEKEEEYMNMLREHVWYREDFKHDEE